MFHGPRRFPAIATAALLLIGTGAVGALRHGTTGRGLAAPSTPPPPPVYVPTPIGVPPAPPTPTAAPSTAPTSGATATVTATAGPGTTPTAVAAVRFTLDAARVAHVNNPGDLSGLIAVKPGTKVWLMMYYTISSIAKNAPRNTTYELQHNGKTFYKTVYKSTAKVSDGVGRFSRFDVYQIPSTQPYGQYDLKVTLTIGKVTQTTVWKFSVAKQERVATTSKSKHR